jgi:DNA-binding NtrC family response regulator
MKPSERILAVDDEETLRRLIQRILTAAGFEVDTAASAEEALERFASGDYGIVLTDLSMAGLGGSYLLEEIKRRSPSTDVIIMTGYPALETAIPALRNGAYDYLIKPFEPELLKVAIVRCMEKRQLSTAVMHEKMLRQDLKAAYEQLKESEQLKEAFSSIIQARCGL